MPSSPTPQLAPRLEALVAYWSSTVSAHLAPAPIATPGPPAPPAGELLALGDFVAEVPARRAQVQRRLAEVTCACLRVAIWRRDQFAELPGELELAAEAAAGRAIGRLLAGAERLAEMDEAAARLWLEGVVAEASRGLAARLPPAGSAPALPAAHRDYSASLQRLALALPADGQLMGPALDLGCGASGALVQALRGAGVPAVGIDRQLADDAPSYLQPASWLEFAFGDRVWGTITSHMAFSLHFLHHHYAAAAAAESYARAFMAIVRSLKPGGLFAFVPALPFFTALIPADQFVVAELELPAPLSQHPRRAGLAAPLAAALGRAAHVRRHALPG